MKCDGSNDRRSTVQDQSHSKIRTIKQPSGRVKKGRKPAGVDLLDSTLDTSALFNQKDASFDPSLLSALDQLKLHGYEEYVKKSDSSLMCWQDTLCKLYSLNFSPGIFNESIFLLKRYLSLPQYCSLSLDIHPIQQMIQYVDDSEFFLGCVAPLSTELKLATEIVVFVVRGLDTDWKGIVGYMLIRHDEDSWALWHTLFKIIEFLVNNSVYVVNVSLSKEFGFEMLEKHSHVDLQGGAFMKHPLKTLDLLCFTRDVLELLKDLSECIVQYNVILTSQILGKYNLVHKILSHENLRLFIGDNSLSSESIFSWLLSWKSTCESVDLSSISLQSETFFMHMMGKWSSIMRTCSQTESLGSDCQATDAHLQFLNEIVWIVQSLEELEENSALLRLWENIRKTTISVLALYDIYVCPGALTCLKPGHLKHLTLHKLLATVEPESVSMPTPLAMLRFIQHVTVAILVIPHSVETDFESGIFLKNYLELCKINIPKDDSGIPAYDELGLHILSSHIVTKLVKENACEKCRPSLVANSVCKDLPPQWLEAVERMGLLHPSSSVYDTLQWAESHLINTEEDIFKMHKAKSQLAFRVYGEMAFSIRNTFPSCHDILRNLLSHFMGIRLQMMAEDLTKSLI